ncbi:cysteine hydrolase [Streptomyces sp. NBC_00441]|uniref:cysteine hydrolase family protein n=1 Tax=Streptomyces sp. NBC_00441 TaxID=2975742 RepID=UPI002E28938B|nr:isochorismatase family cysteine hydrolase [Streptomyces sp. NBC_00441]
MSTVPMDRTALVVIDMVNEIVHPDGKFAGGGWPAEVERRDVLKATATAVAAAREAGTHIFHVTLGFTESYRECPAGSPVLGGAAAYGALGLGSWGAAIHDAVKPEAGDALVVKHRLSPFHGTSLALQLRGLGIQRLLLAGVSTELAVLSAARDAHDLDLQVTVLEDCCAAGSPEVHAAALTVLAATAEVTTGAEALPRA